MANETVEHAPHRAPAPEFSEEQTRHILKRIATAAGTARGLAVRAVCGETHGDNLHALQLIVEQIGFLADLASGSECVGDYADWMLGPLFREPAPSLV